jgi:hypothetical protein
MAKFRIWDDGQSKGPGLLVSITNSTRTVSHAELAAITDRASATDAGIPPGVLDRYEQEMVRAGGSRDDYRQCANWLLWKANPRAFSGNPITGQ